MIFAVLPNYGLPPPLISRYDNVNSTFSGKFGRSSSTSPFQSKSSNNNRAFPIVTILMRRKIMSENESLVFHNMKNLQP